MNSSSQTRRVERSETITLNAPPERVFPLFGPVREGEWAEGWSPEIVYAATPLAEEEGAVFITRQEGQAETVWIVTRYEPEAYRIEYARLTPGATAVRVMVACEAAEGGRTSARVTYEITTLGDAEAHHGESTVRLVESHYPDFLKEWETAINEVLGTGDSEPSKM